MPNADPRLDRRVPTTDAHVLKYPVSALRKLAKITPNVERVMLPPTPKKYQAFYDQDAEGACVGFGESILMSILNRKLFDALWLYRQAQDVDEFHDTPPEQGTSLSAGFDILREKGHRRIYAAKSMTEMLGHGIVSVNRWLTTVDEGRTAIAEGHPIADGIAWFQNFYRDGLVEKKRKLRNGRTVTEWWLPEPEQWGRMVGYHCITRAAASDERQAFGDLNSWGLGYPWPVWVSYRSHEKLMTINGEAAVITDR